VANVSGDLLRTSTAVRADLAMSVATTVRWHDAISRLVGSGVETLIATVPRGRLARLAGRQPGVDVARIGGHLAGSCRPVAR
jgi:malonyl CoA-acyl carrier protein transacylase